MSYCLYCLCHSCQKVDCENRCQLDCNYESTDLVDECEDYTDGGNNDFAECIRDSVKAVFDNATTIVEADKENDNGIDNQD